MYPWALPQWDLGIVPEALSKPPYEPLREASLKHLTLKTVFLLALASAGRCSELQASVFDPQNIQFKPKGSCGNIRDLTKSMTCGTSQRSRLVSQKVLLIAQSLNQGFAFNTTSYVTKLVVKSGNLLNVAQ